LSVLKIYSIRNYSRCNVNFGLVIKLIEIKNIFCLDGQHDIFLTVLIVSNLTALLTYLFY